MPNALILHGKPSKERYEDPEQLDPSDSNWIPWVKHRLTISGYETTAVDFPRLYDPDYYDWSDAFERYPVNDQTTIIAHSAGAGFILKWLSEKQVIIPKKLILVAPWEDPNKKYGRNFKCHHRSDVLGKIGQISVLFSSQDDEQTLKSLDYLREHVLPSNTVYRDIPEYGHFLIGNTMDSADFPELIDEIV